MCVADNITTYGFGFGLSYISEPVHLVYTRTNDFLSLAQCLPARYRIYTKHTMFVPNLNSRFFDLEALSCRKSNVVSISIISWRTLCVSHTHTHVYTATAYDWSCILEILPLRIQWRNPLSLSATTNALISVVSSHCCCCRFCSILVVVVTARRW